MTKHSHCTLGVGCEQAGVCYAAAHNQPRQCGWIEIPEEASPLTSEALNHREPGEFGEGATIVTRLDNDKT